MASMNMDKQLDEQQPPAKKQRIDNPEEEGEIANSNEAGLPKSAEMMGHKESGTSKTSVDLPIRHPLPLELNCEIFKCLKLPIQRKFIWGLGRDIYGIFGQKLLKKTKRVQNIRGNRWNGTNTRATIAADGLNVINNTNGWQHIYAEKGFPISGPHSRVDEFPGTICYYYEVKGNNIRSHVGLSDGTIPDPDNSWIGEYPNSYAIPTSGFYFECWLAGEEHQFELSEGAIIPRPIFGSVNVFGCGLVLHPEDKLAIFFTLNGKLRGRKIPISPTVDCLFPAVTIGYTSSIETNFGDDGGAKPFEYDIHNCPGMQLDCI